MVFGAEKPKKPAPLQTVCMHYVSRDACFQVESAEKPSNEKQWKKLLKR